MPSFTNVPRARSSRAPTSSVSAAPIVSYTTSIPPGNAIGSPSAGCSTPPDHAATVSMSSSRGSGATVMRAERLGQRTLGRSVRRPSPRPSGRTRAGSRSRTSPARPRRRRAPCSPAAGGWRVIPCSDTANGSANTACSSRHRVGDLEQHRVVRGHQLAEPTRHVLAHAGVDPRREVALPERPALAQVAGLARRAVG